MFPLQDAGVTEAMFWFIYRAISWDIRILKAPTTEKNKKLSIFLANAADSRKARLREC